MQIIPVIDIRGGVVVHAMGGNRDGYRPIVTPLAEGSDPVDVVAGFRRLFPFPLVYVADLDGIMQARPDLATIARLSAGLSDVEFLVDNGAADRRAASELMAIPRVGAVIGSETMRTAEAAALLFGGAPERLALSLDYKGDVLQGPAGLLAMAAQWPRRVIAMTLAAVGADAGPDCRRVAAIKALAGPERAVFAAGGVRDAADLDALESVGAAGVLVASALHSGKIKAGDLVRDRRL